MTLLELLDGILQRTQCPHITAMNLKGLINGLDHSISEGNARKLTEKGSGIRGDIAEYLEGKVERLPWKIREEYFRSEAMIQRQYTARVLEVGNLLLQIVDELADASAWNLLNRISLQADSRYSMGPAYEHHKGLVRVFPELSQGSPGLWALLQDEYIGDVAAAYLDRFRIRNTDGSVDTVMVAPCQSWYSPIRSASIQTIHVDVTKASDKALWNIFFHLLEYSLYEADFSMDAPAIIRNAQEVGLEYIEQIIDFGTSNETKKLEFFIGYAIQQNAGRNIVVKVDLIDGSEDALLMARPRLKKRFGDLIDVRIHPHTFHYLYEHGWDFLAVPPENRLSLCTGNSSNNFPHFFKDLLEIMYEGPMVLTMHQMHEKDYELMLNGIRSPVVKSMERGYVSEDVRKMGLRLPIALWEHAEHNLKELLRAELDPETFTLVDVDGEWIPAALPRSSYGNLDLRRRLLPYGDDTEKGILISGKIPRSHIQRWLDERGVRYKILGSPAATLDDVTWPEDSVSVISGYIPKPTTPIKPRYHKFLNR